MAYYYLVAQLPSLSYGQAVPMGSKAFIDLCKTALTHEDVAFLDFCTLDPWALAPGTGVASAAESAAPEFFAKWYAWERTLRLNLARYRASRVKRDVPADVSDYPADAAAAAKAASAMDSPLEAEIFLDEARWQAIEAFQGLDYFDRNTVYAYLLKLLLMERRSAFRADEGFSEYKGLYAAVMEAARGPVSETSTESGERQ
ncbi:hypothetical protein FACS1894109_20240 [Spirochaetia bacterium]|nr:hypothetical protein FACS1894109_20240 [Spirochaetia bacterium]